MLHLCTHDRLYGKCAQQISVFSTWHLCSWYVHALSGWADSKSAEPQEAERPDTQKTEGTTDHLSLFCQIPTELRRLPESCCFKRKQIIKTAWISYCSDDNLINLQSISIPFCSGPYEDMISVYFFLCKSVGSEWSQIWKLGGRGVKRNFLHLEMHSSWSLVWGGVHTHSGPLLNVVPPGQHHASRRGGSSAKASSDLKPICRAKPIPWMMLRGL